ncbi:glycosyltransferase BC10-like [Mercurialis annua]|uniref:glycosyltransferase BC10-like n=1 Tax=Mercurialis annua TaxID=3986 RepID=UPI00215EC5F3|nr:glycosyltransferase BC10-like [Mercurialis annua]
MANEKQKFQSKPLTNTCLKLTHVLHFLFFVIGLSFGMITCSYFKNFLTFPFTNSQFINVYSLSSFSSSSPPPLLPPPPSPESSLASSNSSAALIKQKEYSVMHDMSDDELLSKACNVSVSVQENNSDDHKIVPKLAFMFLTYGPLPLAELWEKYFKGHEGFFSIYVHPHPSYNDSWPETSVFFGRRIPSQAVIWGTGTMIAAERRLLANALLDISNQRFILLSESCIPLVNFKTTYDYLMNSTLSFVQSYDDPKKRGRGRYNHTMSPTINVTNWRKGSQWFEVRRDLAVHIISDQLYYKVFQDHCFPPCYMDEHYIATLVNMLYPEINSNRTITWVDWSRGGPHPVKFGRNYITDEFLNSIRYGSECVYDGKNTTLCFLFARKFLPNALDPLLRISPLVLGYDP